MGDATDRKNWATTFSDWDPKPEERARQLQEKVFELTERAERAERERDRAKEQFQSYMAEQGTYLKAVDAQQQKYIAERDTARRQLAVAREALERIDQDCVYAVEGFRPHCRWCGSRSMETPFVHGVEDCPGSLVRRALASLTDGVQPPQPDPVAGGEVFRDDPPKSATCTRCGHVGEAGKTHVCPGTPEGPRCQTCEGEGQVCQGCGESPDECDCGGDTVVTVDCPRCGGTGTPSTPRGSK